MSSFKYISEPAPEVISYFSGRRLKPSFSWLDVWGEEHAFNFTVAKATKLDVLTTLHSAIDQAHRGGVPFKQFQQNLTPELQRLGWWGKSNVLDPQTGEQITAQLGSPRRLRVIYESNIRSARAAGQWARIQRTKNVLPYLMYMLGPSAEHRPHHESKAGIIRAADDQFWLVWMGPNGWGCKCWVRQISRIEAERRGGVTDLPEIPMQPYTNKRTGETINIPQGVDPGWHTNPGHLRRQNLNAMLSERLETAPQHLRDIAVHDMVTDWLFRRMRAGEVRGTVPVGVLDTDLKEALGSTASVVLLSDYTARKAMRNHADLKEVDYLRVQQLIDGGEVVRESQRHIVMQKKIDGQWWRAVVKVTRDGRELFLSTFHRIHERHRLKGLNSGKVIRE